MPKLCDYISPSDKHRLRRCPAEVTNGDHYCPAHRALVRGVRQPEAGKPDYDDDLLPYSDEEFANLKELRERTK